MKVLVTGARGQLGADLCPLLARQKGLTLDCTDREDLDLCDTDALRQRVLASRPDVILHTAAYTDVDRAERESELCRRLNLDATVCLAEAAERLGASLLLLSSDYVFSGEGEEFYRPSAQKLPLSVYGLSKSLAEDAVLSLCSRAMIVRTSWLFGRHGRNFVYTLLSLAERQEEIPVVCDQIGSPTYTKDLAAALLAMIGTERYGVYHVTNEGVCSRAEFAAEILRLAKCPARVLPVESSAFPRAARRPLNSRLDKDCLAENGFSRLPHWRDALTRFLAETGAIGETNTEGGALP